MSIFSVLVPPPPRPTLFPYTTLFRSYRLTRPVENLKIPATVQAILAARIDRLAPEAKRLLQAAAVIGKDVPRSEEHTSELQSHSDLVCRLLLEKKKRYMAVGESYT